MEPQSLESAYLFLSLLAPGLIILSIRSQFITGRKPPYSEAVLYYFVVSVIYYAIAMPFVGVVEGIGGQLRGFFWLVLIVLLPALIGIVLGLNVQRGWLWRLMRWAGLNAVHEVPSAWDWKFGKGERLWVLIKLKDDTEFAGFCGEKSFISSDPSERDIYIERVYELDDNNVWHEQAGKGVLIAQGEIRTIEIWSPDIEECPHERK